MDNSHQEQANAGGLQALHSGVGRLSFGSRIFRGNGGYDQPVSVLHHTVIELVSPGTGAHRWLFFDNLYTSPHPCDHLLRLDFRPCGTCRPNRKGLPDRISEYKRLLAKGEQKCWQRDYLGCIMWYDKKQVIFLSNQMRVDQLTTRLHQRPSVNQSSDSVSALQPQQGPR